MWLHLFVVVCKIALLISSSAISLIFASLARSLSRPHHVSFETRMLCVCRSAFVPAPSMRTSSFMRFFTTLKLSNLAEDRGIIQTVFPDLNQEYANLIAAKKCAVYAGFDPTADSLHIGNLLPLVGLIHFQRAGIQPVVVIGSATAFIGDPSGRHAERAAVTTEVTAENAAAIRENVERIFHNHEKHFWRDRKDQLKPVKIVDNMEWYEQLSAIDFVGKIGRNFRMGTMMLKDSVQSRLKSSEGMSYAEFSYQSFQAYDWLRLLQKYKCFFQIGGNDQMGNMTAGYELIRRLTDVTPFCFTVPLVKNEAGNKLGKTAGEAVWLDRRKTSVFDYYQYFLRFADTDVERFLKLFTFVELPEIRDLMEAHNSKPDLRKGQKKLAEQLTLLTHGDDGVNLAVKATDAFFGGNASALTTLSMDEICEIYGREFVTFAALEPETSVMNAVMKAKCFHDERDADRIIRAGGVYINHNRVQNPNQLLLTDEHILSNHVTLIRVGKKNHYVIKWKD